MKKIFTIIMTIYLMTSIFCITSFAVEEPASNAVIRVSGLKEDGITLYYPENCDYKDFAEGWEAAVDYACDDDFMDDNDLLRIVVDGAFACIEHNGNEIHTIVHTFLCQHFGGCGDKGNPGSIFGTRGWFGEVVGTVFTVNSAHTVLIGRVVNTDKIGTACFAHTA